MEGIVTQTIQNNSTEIHAIEFSGTPSHPETFTIHSTARHPFWVENLQSWQDASALEPGMQILLVDGSIVDVISNTKSTTDSRVYNFSVHQYENYFAGDFGVLVHNCKIPRLTKHTFNRHVTRSKYPDKSHFIKPSQLNKLIRSTLNNPTSTKLQANCRMVYERLFGRSVGTLGQTGVRVVVSANGEKIVTAFPF